MFAILLTRDNLEKIGQDTELLSSEELDELEILTKRERYYFVRGYTDHSNLLYAWTILPWFILKGEFDYDPVKILTDWDQIVRLPDE